jgi:hypothetical protein
LSVYSTLFYHGTLPTNALTVIYTVPAGQTVVVRDVELLISAANDLFNLQVNVSGTLAVMWYVAQSPATTWHQWSGRVVIPSGGELEAYSALGADQLVVSGYLLSP